MLAAVACLLLLGHAAAQEYILGDSIMVQVDAAMFDKKKLGVDVNVTKFWMKFSGSGANTIDFKPMPVVVARDKIPVTVTLECDFGTVDKPMALPSYVSGRMLTIIGEGNVYRARTKAFVETTTAVLKNVTFGRLLVYDQPRGSVAKVANLQKSFEVTVNNVTGFKNPAAKDWVVQLVEMSGTSFSTFASMNVTKATLITNVPAATIVKLDGMWNKPTTSMKTGLRLLVGIRNGTNPFNFYAIANSDVKLVNSTYVVVADTFKLTAPMSIPEFNVTNITLNDGGLTTSNWWVIAKDQNTGFKFALNCESQVASDFTNFEWFTQPINRKTYPYLPVGKYDLEVVWTSSPSRDANASDYYPVMLNAGMMEVTSHANMAPTPISFNRNSGQALGKIQEGKDISVEVYSVFSTVYVQWFKLSENRTYTNSSNGNYTNGWEAIVGTKTMHPMVPGQTKSISLKVPGGINLTFSDRVRLFGWTEDCDQNHFGQIYANGNITSPVPPSPSPSKSSNALGPGAIVGIVCAVVFVCGVAAWWLCMRKQPTQDRYQKLER